MHSTQLCDFGTLKLYFENLKQKLDPVSSIIVRNCIDKLGKTISLEQITEDEEKMYMFTCLFWGFFFMA